MALVDVQNVQTVPLARPSLVQRPGMRVVAALVLALGGVGLLLALSDVSLADLQRGITSMTPTTIGVMVVGYLVLNVVQAIRSRLVQRPLVPLRMGDALNVRFTGSFLNNVLPARGGDLFRIDRMARLCDVPRATVIGGELHDFWIDKVGWLSAIATLLLFGEAAPWMAPVAGALGGLFVLTIAMTVALARLPESWLTRAPQFVRTMHDGFTNRSLVRLVLIALLVSPLTWLVETFTIYAAAQAAGLSVSPLQAFTVLSAINVAAVVPTPANGGAFEAGGGAALIAAHVSPAFATAFILVYHATQVIVSALVGGSWLGLGRRRRTTSSVVTEDVGGAARDITVREMLPEDAAAWDELASTSAIATLYHHRAWKDIAERGYGMRTHFLIAQRNERVVGILPLFRVPRPTQHYLTSGIFGAYGQIIAADADVEGALVTHATSLAKSLRLDHLHLKILGTSAVAHTTLQASQIWSVALLDLEADSPAQFAKLTGGMRNKIRKAEKSGFTMRQGHDELAAFYDVLAENMHRKGTPMYGMRFMNAVLNAFGTQSDVVTLYENGQAVSGALIAWHNGTMYVPFASSRPAAFPKRVNYLLFWRLIEIAIAKGLTRFDFGTSMQGASTLEFKEQWGTYLSPVTSYFYTANGKLPTATPDGLGIRLFVRAWSHAPRALVDRLGPFILPWTA